MGNNSGFKRVLAIVLAATCMLVFSFSATFAATASPQNATPVPGTVSGEYQTYKDGHAALIGIKSKSIKTKSISDVRTYKGYPYKITTIKAKAFAKAKKLKKINVKGKYLKTVSSKAFKGLKKSQIKKIVVKISKKNKNYKKLKKQFIKAGIAKKNIKFY